ncbi:hypothetical protein ACWGOT_33220 [[Kitasatospora] papulosa]
MPTAQPPVETRHTPDTALTSRDMAADTADLLVREMVAQQMRTTTTAIYRYITYIRLGVLLLCSAIFAAVQVWALRGYLPAELPSPAAWSLPVALQVLVLAAELILLSSAVTRSVPVQATAGAVMAIGYGAEITAHVHEGGQDLVTITLVVMSTLLALCWTLLALALRAGITDADDLVLKQRGDDVEPADEKAGGSAKSAPAPTPVPEPAPVPEPEVEEEEFVQEVVPEHWYTPTPPSDTADTATAPYDADTDTADTDTDAGDAAPAPGAPLSDIEMDAVVHMIATETDPPRSLREMEARFRELRYVGSAARLRESWRRVNQPANA